MTHSLAITGIGGFIGHRMAERALAMGWKVRGLDLSPAGVQRARALGAEVVVGGVNDAEAVSEALRGADIVFHTAAIVEEDGPRELYDRVNVEGTRLVASLARSAGVACFVQLSSVMVYGFDYPPDVTEAGPFTSQGNPYNDTKLLSEQVAMGFHEPGVMDVIVIRPGDVYGPGSMPWVVRPLDLIRKGLFMLPDGGRGVINHVHVDNLIDGLLLAVAQKAGGQVFTITDGLATPCSEFFAHHARFAGKKSVPTLPAPLMLGAAWLMHKACTLVGIKPPGSPAAVRFLSRRHRYSIEKARQVLGYAPRITLQDGMAELFPSAPSGR